MKQTQFLPSRSSQSTIADRRNIQTNALQDRMHITIEIPVSFFGSIELGEDFHMTEKEGGP